MSATTVVQTRLSPSLVKTLDTRASEAGITRAELLRMLLEAALDEPQTSADAVATDPLVAQIADELGTLMAKVDACLTTSRNAHAAARLAGLMLLPADKQQAYIDKLTQAVRP
ncbi:MAG: hypothetical protein K5799_05070 [Erythrobacter sp.]|nr:hypothetical protein [Erythrobacter sp.]